MIVTTVQKLTETVSFGDFILFLAVELIVSKREKLEFRGCSGVFFYLIRKICVRIFPF